MPRIWYDRHAVPQELPDDRRSFLKSIAADRKPYFMRYIYPALSKQYNNYIKAADKNAMREFDMTLDELLSLPVSELSDRQFDFIQKYKRYLPVGTGDCVMNRVCRKIESEFRGYKTKAKAMGDFDYTVLKSGTDYSSKHFKEIRNLMNEYNQKLKEHTTAANCDRIGDDERRSSMALLDEYFQEKCASVCPDAEELCDIVLDLCYSNERTKQFAWKMCGAQIVKNLMNANGKISFPKKNEHGNITWKSDKFSIETIELDVIK